MTQILQFTLQPRLDRPLSRTEIARLFLAFGETAELALGQRTGRYLSQTLRAIEASTDLDLSELIEVVDGAFHEEKGLTSQQIAEEIGWNPARVDTRLAAIGLQYRQDGQWRATRFGKSLVLAQDDQAIRWRPAILTYFMEVV